MPISKQNRTVQYDLLRELLLRKRGELSQDVEKRHREIIKELAPQNGVGAGSREVSAGMAIVNMEREMRVLVEIDLSLRRLDAGHYGICGVCEEQIPMARLKAIPWTCSCVDCAGGPPAEHQEAQSAQDGDAATTRIA